MYAEDQNRNHKGNCRFACAAISQKLNEMGFENYTAIITLDNGESHCSNIFYSREFGCWMVADLSDGIGRFFSGYPEFARVAGFSYLPTYIHNMIHKSRAVGMSIMNECSDKKLTEDKIGSLDISEFLNIYARSGRPIGMEIPAGDKRTEFEKFVMASAHDEIYKRKCQQVQRDRDSRRWE